MCLIASSSAVAAAFPPKPLISPPPPPSNDQNHKLRRFRINIFRREAIAVSFLALVPSLHQPSPAIAFSIGISKGDSDYGDKDLEEVQRLLRSATMDCVPQERNSFVTFQAKTGVEVCTFRLVVKNASSLLDDNDPIKLEAEASLRDLVRSFTSLNAVANDTDIQLPSIVIEYADLQMVATHLNSGLKRDFVF
ncbi:hypothetical protein TEA_006187 [Camellia sinensis var. sinensis]|uniref:Uncharacterized protein n=1 Tax=Camellia sinensis var. sinensis TaxID=542762 RepID=A0A4S4DRX1_CAMSN|nr:hypothetical protein TEA_006187 [Camellia sinensis var. sinensis]